MGVRQMDREEINNEDAVKDVARPRRRSATKRSVQAQPITQEFLSKDDISHFLSIKPYLSGNGRKIVEILEELEHMGGRLDSAVLTKLLGLIGGGEQNMAAALGPLLAMLGSGGAGGTGKMDPTALLPLLAGASGGQMDPSTLLPLLTAMTKAKQETNS